MSVREAWDRSAARTLELVGNEPLALDGSAVVRVVESGSVGVFCAEFADGAPAGPRRPLFRIGSGGAAFSVGSEQRDGLRFSMVPIKRTVIREAPVAELWSDPRLRSVVADLLDEWVHHLAGVLEGGREPKLVTRTGGGGTVALDEGEAFGPERNAVVWTRVHGGAARCMGREDLDLNGRPGLFPLGPGTWVEADEPTNVETHRAAEVDEWSRLEPGVARLHAMALYDIRMRAEAESDNELVRLLERDLVHAGRTEAAHAQLAEVLGSVERPPVDGDPLMRAVTAVGQSVGIEIRPPGKSEVREERSDPLDAIARASRVRTRRVALSGRWWKHDCGSLLGYTAEDGRPVAILRTRALRYEVYDPIEGSREPLDERLAGTLAAEAVAFYRPLPEGKLRVSDLFRFAMQRRGRDLTLVVLTGIVVTLLGMITPQATAILMDHAIPDADRRVLLEIGAGLIAAAFGRLVFQLSQGIVLLRISIASEAESQAALWDRLLRLQPSFFRRFSSGDLQSRVMAVTEVGREISGATLTTIFSSFLALLNLALLYYYSPSLSLIAVAMGLIVMVFTTSVSMMVRVNLRELMEREGHFFGFVVQLISAVGKLRVAGASARAYTQWVGQYGAQLKLEADILRLREKVYVFNHVLPILSSAVLFLMAFGMLQETRASGLSDGLTLGTFLAFNVAFATFLGGVTSLSSTIVSLLDIFAKARRIEPILEEEPEIDVNKADPGRLTGRIACNSVDFQYRSDGPRILQDVSFEAEPGEFIALVGPSGSGKSTIMRVLLGFETPTAGSVTYDGQDLASVDVLAVRRQLGVVLQGGKLDAGSIFDNIASGNVITLDDAWAAAEEAGFGEDVREMPMGMHTVVSVGGGNLSGGQRQRLLIARALAQRPRMLLFDEATSALDNRTQQIVSESLERLRVTRIVIAHRLSTVRNADRIYVVEAGKVVQRGTFEDLMREPDRLFARMMARQLA